MVETIAPVVYGRRSRYITALTLHTLAATATAAVTGAVLGTIGLILGAPWGTAGAVALAAVAGVYALREALRLPIPLPNARRQVPEWWRTFYSPPVAATLYGAGLGIAFLTFLSYGTFVAVAAAALVAGDPLLGAGLCAGFGFARGAAVAIAGLRSKDPGAAVSAVAGVGATAVPRVVNTTALVAVGLAVLTQFA